ncbi:MAG TPA: ABC transporter permease [Thermoleophilia bacterium]|jgi:peptide/nickel transport system permease protein|nr:ABC transporter permease [Acidobacteriota bacterium]NLT92805.1 ABC transporter permease [Actinomycetota bacterium]OPZ45261.1 MAG: Glutathione transport system permease protein GsiC [Actinobacteria bacterium ADurb.BinA094]HQF51762.1 ABC transporter permease [Thermoleophilia bacterium]HQH21203.1 ABC transporter permease [Thermoleophilia bacterium]
MPPLLKLILIRLGLGLLTLFLVTIVVFIATQGLPGDAARAILGKEATNVARYEALREELGLDRPMLTQYTSWLAGVATGDFGTSLVGGGQKVTTLLGSRVANSAMLVFLAALVSIPISIVLGATSAIWRDSRFDNVVNLGNLSLAALPEFVIGIVLVLIFATAVFKWLPSVSNINALVPLTQQMWLFVLPVATLVLAVIPYVSRMLRASTVEVLESEYVMMARLKGISESRVLWHHALPNAIVPTIQVIAINIAWLAGGIVTVEYLFGFPGIGSALVDAVANRDMPVVQALVLLVAAVYVVLNLIADILTILISPRLRTGLR